MEARPELETGIGELPVVNGRLSPEYPSVSWISPGSSLKSSQRLETAKKATLKGAVSPSKCGVLAGREETEWTERRAGGREEEGREERREEGREEGEGERGTRENLSSWI